MIVTHYSGWLQGVHGVGRGVGGVLWYPLTAFTMYALVFNIMQCTVLHVHDSDSRACHG